MNKDNKVDGFSYNPQQDLLGLLEEKAPEVFSEGKIDSEKLKATLGDMVSVGSEKYGLNWAGKSGCFAEIQKPTTNTLNPIKGKSIDFDNTENIFIEGENLEVLKILQRSYFNKIKMIYIDPPYNTGSDSFIYADDFKASKEGYEKDAGLRDENGELNKDSLFRKNTADSGRYHSNWLNMMYPRLFLARNLLSEDGIIFVSIDDNEVHNLRLILDEIFGEENFIETLVWKKRATPPNDRNIGRIHEYILCYSKSSLLTLGLLPRDASSQSRYSNPDNDPRGDWAASDLNASGKGGRLVASLVYPIKNPQNGKDYYPSEGKCWLFNKVKVEKYILEGRISFRESTGTPFLKRYANEVRQGVTLPTILSDFGFSQHSAQETDEIFGRKGIFEFPKPIKLLKGLLTVADTEGELILDFFAGSGATAQAVLELNREDNGKRKYIMVQLPEIIDPKTDAGKAGYQTIADVTLDRISKVSNKLSKENRNNDLGVKTYKLDKSNFKIWQSEKINNAEDLQQQLLTFTDIVQPKSTKESILYEIMLKAGFSLTENVEEKQNIYNIGNGIAAICLEEKITEKIINDVTTLKPQLFICLDNGFAKNDQLKTNTKLQLKDKGIEFKVI